MRKREIDHNALRIIVPLVVCLLASVASFQSHAATTDWPDLLEKAKAGVVLIIAKCTGTESAATGSGALITPDGYILTAAHVVRGADDIQVVVGESELYPATIVRANDDADIAVLKISGNDFPWLSLGDAEDLKLEAEIRLLGYPKQGIGIGLIIGIGRFLGQRETDEASLLQMEISPFDHGHSGGPVINQTGEVVGVAVRTEIFAERLAKTEDSPYITTQHHLAISVETAKQIIPSGILPRGPSPLQPSPSGRSGRYIFTDNFNYSGSGWGQQRSNTYEEGYEMGEYYIQLSCNAQGSSPRASYVGGTNFVAEVDVRIIHGASNGACGLIWGPDHQNAYIFAIGKEQSQYAMAQVAYGQFQDNVHDWEYSSSINSNGWNRLRVISTATEVQLFINGKFLTTVDVGAHGWHYVGVIANAFSCDGPYLEARFDNFVLREYLPE